MSIFTQAALALFAATSSANGGLIVLVRPGVGQSVQPVMATFGKSILEVGQTDGSRVEVETNDFILPRAAYSIAGNVVTPKEGDRVVSKGITYELMTPPYSPSGPTDTMLRLHSKIVG